MTPIHEKFAQILNDTAFGQALDDPEFAAFVDELVDEYLFGVVAARA